jgi:hypothetical protein
MGFLRDAVAGTTAVSKKPMTLVPSFIGRGKESTLLFPGIGQIPGLALTFQSTRDVQHLFQFVSVTGLAVISRIEGGRT